MHQGRKRNKCQEKKENARRKSSNPRNQSWRFSVRGLRKLCASQVYRLLSPWFHTQRREGDRKHEDDRVPRGTMAATKLFPNSLPNFLSPLWCICNSPTRFPPFPCFFFFPVLYSFHQATRLRIGFHPDGFVASFFSLLSSSFFLSGGNQVPYCRSFLLQFYCRRSGPAPQTTSRLIFLPSPN